MPVPWLRILDAAIGLRDVARVARKPDPPPVHDPLAGMPNVGALEKTLAGVVVAALKEAFDRDHQRLELERERLDAERRQSERALRAELRRQAADREIGRLRLVAGLAVTSWLATLLFSARVIDAGVASRVAVGAGWLLLLAALATALVGHSQVAAALGRADESRSTHDPIASASAGTIATLLVVGGLAAIALATLLA